MPALMASGADKMRLMHDAPRLRRVGFYVYVIFRHADLDVMHIEDHPWLAGVFHDPIPSTSPQTRLFGALSATPSPSLICHDYDVPLSIMSTWPELFDRGAATHEHEDRRLRHDEVRLLFEGELHRRFTEE